MGTVKRCRPSSCRQVMMSYSMGSARRVLHQDMSGITALGAASNRIYKQRSNGGSCLVVRHFRFHLLRKRKMMDAGLHPCGFENSDTTCVSTKWITPRVWSCDNMPSVSLCTAQEKSRRAGGVSYHRYNEGRAVAGYRQHMQKPAVEAKQTSLGGHQPLLW